MFLSLKFVGVDADLDLVVGIEEPRSTNHTTASQLGLLHNVAHAPARFVGEVSAILIVNTGDESFRLSAASPAIDSWDPDLTGISFADLDGRTRVLCGQVDMGAYESGVEGDANCDGSLDLLDTQHWPTCLTGPADAIFSQGALCASLDVNTDGHFDLKDIALLQSSFGFP